MAGLGAKLKHAWNAFSSKDEDSFAEDGYVSYSTFGARPPQHYTPSYNRKQMVASIYNRLSVDAAALPVRHVRVGDNDQFSEEIMSELNYALKVSANIDQSGREMIQDAVWTMLNEGLVALIPMVTTVNPKLEGSYDIRDLRVGIVEEFLPKNRVRISAFNEETQQRDILVMPKSLVGIAYNPFYAAMNLPNSTLQRLLEKLRLLDKVDAITASGKLDLIIQLPYVVKSQARREQAIQRAQDIDFQLRTNSHGIAYTDGTEKITQLNRPVESSLWGQVEKLTEQLHTELGLSPAIMNRTADEATMLNYHNGTVEPIIAAIVDAMDRKFLTKTARTQGQRLMAFRDPFRFVPMEKMAEIADKFTRNEILSSNEIRSSIGVKPSKDPKADELRNSNMPEPKPEPETQQVSTVNEKEGDLQNGS